MNEEEFKECSVVAYPHEIRFLHIKGGYISYYVDRHISDYVNKLQKENQQLKEQLQQKEDIINKIREYLTSYESISEIEGLNNVKENKKLDEKTMNEMIRRYMNVHDKILEILDNKGDE